MTGEETLIYIRSPEGLCAARDLLSGALRLDAEAALALARLDRMRARARRGRADREAIRQEEARLLSLYKEKTARQQTIGAVIRRVPDENARTVLRLHYLEGMPFFRVAMQMNYDERQIYRILRRGLSHVALQTVLNEKNNFFQN